MSMSVRVCLSVCMHKLLVVLLRRASKVLNMSRLSPHFPTSMHASQIKLDMTCCRFAELFVYILLHA